MSTAEGTTFDLLKPSWQEIGWKWEELFLNPHFHFFVGRRIDGLRLGALLGRTDGSRLEALLLCSLLQSLSYCALKKQKISFSDHSQHPSIPPCPQQSLSAIVQTILLWLHRQSFLDCIKILPWFLYAIVPHTFCNCLAVVFVVECLLFIDKHAHPYMLQS